MQDPHASHVQKLYWLADVRECLRVVLEFLLTCIIKLIGWFGLGQSLTL